MRAKLLTICALFFSLFFLACGKDAPEPETPATADRPAAPAETSFTVPVGTATPAATAKALFPPLEVRMCHDGKQVLVMSNDRLTVQRDGRLMLCLYPEIRPADAQTVHVDGPFAKADRGDLVLLFKGKDARAGEQKVELRVHDSSFQFWLLVTEPPAKKN